LDDRHIDESHSAVVSSILAATTTSASPVSPRIVGSAAAGTSISTLGIHLTGVIDVPPASAASTKHDTRIGGEGV